MSIANRISGLRVKRFALGATVVSVVAALLAGSPSVPAQAGGSPKLAQATQPLVLAHRLEIIEQTSRKVLANVLPLNNGRQTISRILYPGHATWAAIIRLGLRFP